MRHWRTAQALASRVVERFFVLAIVATVLFLMFRLMPGDPTVAYISPTFTGEQADALRKSFGLDKPLSEQYVIYMGNLLRGNLGESFFYKKSVAQLMGELLPNTIMLTLTSLLLAYAFGIVAGIALASRRGTRFETGGILYTLVSRSAPEFWVGMILLTVFAFKLNWFPASGATSPGVIYPNYWAQVTSVDFWRHLFLPAVTMAFYLQGLPLLLMRSNMLDVLEEDFVTMARMKGISERAVVMRHAARNALLPVVTALALGIGYAIGGNVVVETIFSWPGLGRMLVRSVSAADYPVAQGAFFVLAALMIFMNLFADIMYYVLDPRVGRSKEAGA